MIALKKINLCNPSTPDPSICSCISYVWSCRRDWWWFFMSERDCFEFVCLCRCYWPLQCFRWFRWRGAVVENLVDGGKRNGERERERLLNVIYKWRDESGCPDHFFFDDRFLFLFFFSLMWVSGSAWAHLD